MEDLLVNIASILALVGSIAVVLRKTVLELDKVLNRKDEVPDQGVEGPNSLYPSTMPDLSDEDMREILGSEELQMKNKLFDEKIARMKEEVQRPGELYDEDHNVIAGEYIPKPTHEYAE